MKDLLASFTRNATLSGAEILPVQALEELPALLASRIPAGNSLALSPQAELNSLTWQTPVSDERSAQWGIACAELAIAETGTLCLSSRSVPSALLYLVEFLVVVIEPAQIVARQEGAWRSAGISSGHRPRAMHLITGPSRTADVEQTLQVGAHGPRELLIVVLDPSSVP
nr:LUD domain-containing protein [Pseudomaricurvus sp. HS19]